MPISRDDFKRGRKTTPLEGPIMAFLKKHPEQAYLSGEVARGVAKHQFGVNFLNDISVGLQVYGVLETLAKDGVLEKKQVGTDSYYALRRKP